MSLVNDILQAFERACAERDTEVAEKLLEALEVIDARSAADELDPGLARAYLAIADGVSRHVRPDEVEPHRVAHGRRWQPS